MSFALSAVRADSWPELGGTPPPGAPFVDYGAHYGARLDTVTRQTQEYTILRCAHCQIIHAWPLPDEAALAAYYQEHFYARSHPDYLARYEHDRDWWMLTHRMILCRAGVLAGGDTPRLLDVGTGPGVALDAATSLNWQTTGLEPDAAIARIVRKRGHKVHAVTLEEFCQMKPPRMPLFDVLYAYEVLEHTANPAAFLQRCRALLRPGGVLCVVVPNDYNPLQLAARARHALEPWWVQPPEHLQYFTPRSLAGLLARGGLTIRVLRGTYPLELAMLRADPVVYVGNDALGRELHTVRMQYELDTSYRSGWADLEWLYTLQLVKFRIGRELVALAQKP